MTTYPDATQNPNAAGPVWIAGPPPASSTTALYVNAKQVIKSTPGTVVQVNVLVAGAAGTINDCATTAAIATGNEVAIIPATIGPVFLNFPCLVGIAYNPGASQIVSIQYW